MRPFFSNAAGLASVVLSVLLLPVTLARPTDNGIFRYRQSQTQDPGPRPLYYEHKFQRIYRNDDSYSIRSAVNTRRKHGDKGSSGANTTNNVTAPRIQSAKVLGASPSHPEMQFINLQGAPLPHLPSVLYAPRVNIALTQSPAYSSLYNGSGSLELNATTRPYLEKLRYTPLMSRDGGYGGKIGRHHLFIFSDTETYTTETSEWTGFVSNSVASNRGGQAKAGKPPLLHDKLGEWANNIGTMRNWIPFTDGEAAFNAKMEGKGQRYGIWPSSSLIPIDRDSALLYAPIIFTNTNDGTALSKLVHGVGTTLVKVTVPGRGGAIAERVNPLIFPVDEGGVEWGTIGGIRGYGPAGTDGGKVYIMGNHKGGLKLGRVDVANVADGGSYEFWQSDGSWSASPNSAEDFMDGEYSTADIFYSPKHSTFVMTFMTPYADNKFYWRYLHTPSPIKPSAPEEFVEHITKHPWSDPMELLDLPKPAGASYAYAGGMHRGYFDGDDISSGGAKMLLSWTQPTGLEPNNPKTGFYHMTAEVTFA